MRLLRRFPLRGRCGTAEIAVEAGGILGIGSKRRALDIRENLCFQILLKRLAILFLHQIGRKQSLSLIHI